MLRRATLGFIATVCAIATASPLPAQSEPWLDALTTPPRNVGTCAPRTPSPTKPGVTRIRLIMVSTTPGARRREMWASVDSSGRLRSYTDVAFTQAGLGASRGEDVFATIDMLGHATGRHMHTTTTMKGVPPHGDSAAVRRWMASKQHAVTESTTEQLDAATQTRVVELAKWLVSRCK